MGRKHALAEFHRKSISDAASELFAKNGIDKTTVDDIAKAAGYSKATVYVYFESKDDIIRALTAEGMSILLAKMRSLSGKEHGCAIKRCYSVFAGMVEFYEANPFYYELLLNEINVDIEKSDTHPVYKEIYDTGEAVNNEFFNLLEDGIHEGAFRKELDMRLSAMFLWFTVSGIIKMAAMKEKYIEKTMKLSKKQFLDSTFEMLLRTIVA